MDIEKIFSRINLLFTTIAAAITVYITVQFGIVKEKLAVQAAEINNTKLIVETQQAKEKFGRDFKISLLSELKTAFNNKEKDTLYCTIAVAFVRDMLADDPMKDAVMEVFANSPYVPQKIQETIKQEQLQTQAFNDAEDVIKKENKTTPVNYNPQQATKIRIDVFYVENLNQQANLQKAQTLANKLKANDNYEIKVRQLPAAVNLRSGYKLTTNELRYDTGEEDIATTLETTIKNAGVVEFQKKQTNNVTPNYLSFFITN